MRPDENEFRQGGMKFETQVELLLNEVNGGKEKDSSSLPLIGMTPSWVVKISVVTSNAREKSS